MKIQKSKLPDQSLSAGSFPLIHYRDSYSCTFQSAKPISPDDLVYAFFDAAPVWVSNLLSMRNKLARLVGLKVASENARASLRQNFKVEKGTGLGLFKVIDKRADEVLLGDDDKHLNFRISFHLTDTNPTKTFTLSTTVYYNNTFGRVYFIPVKPFHKIIVPAMMRAIVKKIS
ncbi:DUF2867 domain-containing protein [Pedobacter sp. SYSU D00535]|uniref:DUF2867 domain-containing protein n=1 Tax=Pedobacter sp. SYSU D00535 TaxID=2810308 RepID=UPI001A972BA6|nr:DUF2867 domain-containing protein [Pedobacter sp. SYSU D00535]